MSLTEVTNLTTSKRTNEIRK
uniref:Uncharacterized protein n=1 Tax=Anguilla anguilla TaxID=7936 RepID=A0A0E9VSL5_ANGAN